MEKRSGLLSLLVLVPLLLLALAQGAGAIHIRDNLFFSVPKNGYENVILVLPDDLGLVRTAGSINYVVRSTASSAWDNIEESLSLTTTENGTLVIPIEFSGYGKKEGDCSGTFKISVSSPSMGSREWTAGVCISEYRDVDTAPGAGDAWDTLNSNTDYFDMGFEIPTIYADVGNPVQANLLLQSYADLNLEVNVTSRGLAISPTEQEVSLSSSNPQETIMLIIQSPPESGEYEVSVVGKIKGCTGLYCTKIATTRIVFGREESFLERAFTITLFPSNINIKDIVPVSYQLTVYNPGSSKTVNVSLSLPGELTSEFDKAEVYVSAGKSKAINITVTPQADFGTYEIEVTAVYGGSTKKETAELSINEMLSDTMRESGHLLEGADQGSQTSLDSAMQEWMDKYKKLGYGSENEDFNTLRAKFEAEKAKQASSQPSQNGQPSEEEPEYTNEQPSGFPLWAVAIIVAALVIIGLLFYRMKSSGKKETEEPVGFRI